MKSYYSFLASAEQSYSGCRRLLFLFLACQFIPFSAYSQNETDTLSFYWVSFSDKHYDELSSIDLSKVLSERSWARRQKAGGVFNMIDLPVVPAYMDSLSAAGLRHHHHSNWFNAATVIGTAQQIDDLQDFSFVDTVYYLGPVLDPVLRKFQFSANKASDPQSGINGQAQRQLHMIGMDSLLAHGPQGEGVLVAVFDGGFIHVDSMAVFDSLRQNGRLLDELHYDFVEGDHGVYESSSHGTKVLSLMAANLPGQFRGSAPHASYILCKTEDTRAEYMVEVANWVAALEYAEALGVDVVNSSLGYTTFSDTNMDYTYDNLNGTTSWASQAATIAAERGMIVVNSAGNEGSSPWKHIGVPADADGALAIGATTFDSIPANFSSFGLDTDPRIKPDFAAPGQRVNVADAFSNRITSGNGTSYSSPLFAGGVVSLWSAFPALPPYTIIKTLKENSHLNTLPHIQLGHGLPNFWAAYQSLKNEESFRKK